MIDVKDVNAENTDEKTIGSQNKFVVVNLIATAVTKYLEAETT